MNKSTKKLQIYQLLKERIDSGFYPAGSRLPIEADFAAELGICRKTLRAVLEELDKENRVERIKGVGTFIRDAQKFQTRILMVVHTLRSDISDPYVSIMPGVRLEAEKLNVYLETCSYTSLLSAPADKVAAQILENNFQGIIYFASRFHGNEPIIEVLKKTKLPVILPHALKEDYLATGFSVMGTDYLAVMADGLRYLATQGHRRVGHITPCDMRGISPSDYFRLVRNAGLDDDHSLLFTVSDRSSDAIQRGAAHLLTELDQPPTALFCYSDPFALHVYEYLQQNHIRIPEDVAVLSIGGQIGCNLLTPSLSAIDFQSIEIGVSAIHLMLDMIKYGRIVSFTVTPHCIMERESTKK